MNASFDGAAIRMRGLGHSDRVAVRPRLAATAGSQPAMAGEFLADGADTLFVPSYAFVEGATYEVVVGDEVVSVLERPRQVRVSEAEVVAIYPSSDVVPQNLLRLYVHFSHPMSEGQAHDRVRLVDADGRELAGALLDTQYELWDASRRRLTVLLDPGRIKQGLADHEAAGYPLRLGETFRAVVDSSFADASGAPLVRAADRPFLVAGVESRRVAIEEWDVVAPIVGSRAPVTVTFGRPLDRGLLARCIDLARNGAVVRGVATVGAGERSWSFVPDEPWAPGEHALRVDPVLEDVAGNSVTRVFDREVASVSPSAVVTEIAFTPR